MGDERVVKVAATTRVAQIALAAGLLALAVNAVLIQTVMTDGGLVKNVVRAGVLALTLAGLAANWRTVARWLAVPIALAGALLVARSNQDQLTIIFAILLAALAGQVSERFFLGWAAIASFVPLVLMFGFLAVGLTEDTYQVSDFDQVVRTRHDFGVESIPWIFNAAYGAFTLAVLYASKHLTRAWFAAVVVATLAAATTIYTLSDTRGGFAAFLIFLALLAIVPMIRVGWLWAAAPFVLFGLTMWLSLGDIDAQINRVLSQRPLYFHQFFGDITWTDVFLTRSVKKFPYPVDSSFLHLMVGAGLVVLIAFLALYARAVVTLMRARRHAEVAFLTATIAYCASEGLLVRIENAFIIVVWYLVLHYGVGLVRGGTPQAMAGDARRDRGRLFAPRVLAAFTTDRVGK